MTLSVKHRKYYGYFTIVLLKLQGWFEEFLQKLIVLILRDKRINFSYFIGDLSEIILYWRTGSIPMVPSLMSRVVECHFFPLF